MLPLSGYTAADVLVLLSIAVFLIFIPRIKEYKRRKYPPGPKGIPILGNLQDIPKEFEWKTYRQWSKIFGSDILRLRILRTNIIILNSADSVRDLLEKRSNIYSDREHMTMLLDLVGWGWSLAFMGYNRDWRERRKVFHQHFYSNIIPQYHSRMATEAKGLLKRLLDKPDDFMVHIRTMTGALILGITFGIDVQDEYDPFIQLAETALQSMAAVGNVGAYLVDYIPLLQHIPAWVPGTSFKRDATVWRQSVLGMRDQPFRSVKQAMANGTAQPSILSSLLGKLDPNRDNEYDEDVIRGATGAAYIAGADTTVSSLGTFILAMVLNPEVQTTAQAEVDRIVGGNRLPSFKDRDLLPYTTAVVKEALRWQNVTPLAAPHKLMVDDEYKGYHLPAGSLVVGNAWAILHDEKTYPNPEKFDPARYLTADGRLDKDAPDPSEAAFGFGRRICPGRHFAIDSMWITIASILSTLDIRTSTDECGNPLVPSGEYTPGMISYPVPFKASIRPRSAGAAALIQTSAEESN